MKDIEINSDKYTTLEVCFVLAVVLITFLANLYALIRHRPAAHSNLEIGIYLAAVFNTYFAVIVCRDSRLRKAYPYGIVGACGMAAVPLMAIAVYWTKASSETQNLAGTILIVLNILASALVLVEGVRWFTKRVKLGTDV
jgi:hypothetical protein